MRPAAGLGGKRGLRASGRGKAKAALQEVGKRCQGHCRGWSPKAPVRARVCLLLLYRLYGQASLVILDPRAELERLRMLKEYELGGDVLQGD
jgi:hypothetical protein